MPRDFNLVSRWLASLALSTAVWGSIFLFVSGILDSIQSKVQRVRNGMTVEQVEGELGNPIPNGILDSKQNPSEEQRIYDGGRHRDIIVNFRNGFVTDVHKFEFRGSTSPFGWQVAVLVVEILVWSLLAIVFDVAYRRFAAHEGGFSFGELFRMPRFSLARLFIAITLVIVGISGMIYLFRYGQSATLGASTGISAWLISGTLIGAGALNLLERPILGAMLGFFVQASIIFGVIMLYLMNPAIG